MPDSHNQPSENKKWQVNGTPLAIIVMIVMVITLVLFVSIQERRTIINPVTMTQTAVQQQVLQTGDPTIDAQNTPVTPGSVVNVNGILFMGGLLVIIVLVALFRETLRQTK
jgi:hypothetical protein